MFGKTNESPQWKINVAKEYVEKMLSQETGLITKQIDESLSILKKDAENSGLTSKIKDSLQNFLISNGLLSPFKGILSRQLLSENSQKQIEQAQKDLSDSSTEQEARQKLGLAGSVIVVKEKKEESNNLEKNEQQEKIEHLNITEQYIVDQAKKYGITDKRQLAYILSTVKGECGFKNIKEIGGTNRWYGKKDPQTGQNYYGRGFVQLTHKGNYEKFTKIIKEKNIKFRDNSGKELTSTQTNLVQNPDTILKSNELASFILIEGMKIGSFTGKKMSDFINDQKTDFYNARSIINGMSSSPDKFANRAKEYLNKIENKKLNKTILVGSNILANYPQEFGGLGNSIMSGFQGYSSKKYFKNMDGIEGKSTQTHPNRFKSLDDVKERKNNHPGVKSFIMYFGANTTNNTQTLRDLEQRSNRLKKEGIQPVLSTCIGEDNNKHLAELNPKILELGKKLNSPVLDFAFKYNQEKKLFAMGSNKHPSSTGYNFMKDEILSASAA